MLWIIRITKTILEEVAYTPPENTVRWGTESTYTSYNTKDNFPKRSYEVGRLNGKYLDKIPKRYDVNTAFLKKGQEKYDIYCSVCHTKTGDGTKSIISQNGWIVSNILQDVTYKRSDGELYHIISNGVRSMPGYKKRISVKDRWAIVSYVRALQKMSRSSYSELSKKTRSELGD